ncbi:hypothetical protein AMTRI_Chr04g247860 [Amborella trichopoda]
MGELAQMAEEILKLEKLVSLILNPPISPLLYFVPSIFGYVEDRLEEFKGDLAYRGRFHLTLKAHLLKEGDIPILRCHIVETEILLSRVRMEMGDLPLSDLESSGFPLLARQTGSLPMAALKDRLAIKQRVSAKVGVHKE